LDILKRKQKRERRKRKRKRKHGEEIEERKIRKEQREDSLI